MIILNNKENMGYDAQNIEQNQLPEEMPGAHNSVGSNVTDFGKGVANGVKSGLNLTGNNQSTLPGFNNLAKGMKNKLNELPDNKLDNQNKNNNPNGNAVRANGKNRNPAKGQGLGNKDNNKNSDKFPRANKKDNSDKTGANNNINKNGDNKSDPLNKKKDKNKDGFTKKTSPLGRSSSEGSKQGLGKRFAGSAKDGAAKAGKVAAQGLKKMWMVLPIQVKVIVTIAVPVLIILALVLLAVFGGVTGAVVSTMCDSEESSSSYNGETYSGSDDVTSFTCSIQHPLANKGVVTSAPGGRWGRTHEGVDIGIPSGTNVYAAQAGVVTHAGWEGAYGNSVVIKHTKNITTRYGHNTKVLVKAGDKVGKGQLIAKSGSTGRSTGPHLHFEIRYKGVAQLDLEGQYFINTKKVKKQCGSSWGGKLEGDSANEKNNTSNVNVSDSEDSSSDEQCCVTTTSSGSSSPKDYCKNGITVSDAGTLDLDEYVAGVVSAENYYVDSKHPKNLEAMKAQAIAARTYAVNSTNNCKKTIGNSQAAQVYTKAQEKAKQAAKATSGIVMLYKGKVFSSQYDAFCINDGDCPSASCSGSTCTAKYTKVPSNETHTITVKAPHSSAAVNGSLNGVGHAHGMSQYVARQMQDEGKKYDEILKFFYADGIEITGTAGNTCSIGGDGYSGKIKAFYQNDYTDVPYCSGSATIATSGCGPTSMAIVVSSLLGKTHDPVEIAKYSCQHNFVTPGVGTQWGFFASVGKKFGLKVQQVGKDQKGQDEVLIALNSGKKMVIAATNKKPFTSGGHFIVLTSHKDGKVFVQDPNENNKSKLFSFEKTVVPASTQFWIISKG